MLKNERSFSHSSNRFTDNAAAAAKGRPLLLHFSRWPFFLAVDLEMAVRASTTTTTWEFALSKTNKRMKLSSSGAAGTNKCRTERLFFGRRSGVGLREKEGANLIFARVKNWFP